MRTAKEWWDWCKKNGTDGNIVFDILTDWEEEKKQECVWQEDDWEDDWDESYDTDCGKKFSLSNDESLEGNGFNFCPYCRKRITERRKKEKVADDSF